MRGIYTAATGLLNKTRSMDVTGNNLANLETAGYKRDTLTQRAFGEHLTYLLAPQEDAAPVGSVTHGVISDETITQYGQGAMAQTGRCLDFAISGDGFFTMALPDGTALSRNGRFSMDNDGYLTDSAGNRVLGYDGEIRVQTADFTVDESGNIYVAGRPVAALRITCPADLSAVSKLGEGYYGYDGETVGFSGKVTQRALESSNVDVATEMAGMIADTRAFQSCVQIVRTMDEMAAKAVQLGSLK